MKHHIGLLMPPDRNRELLARTLGDGFDVSLVDPPGPVEPGLDLVVADARSFAQALAADPPPTLLLVRGAEKRTLPPATLAAAAGILTLPVPQHELVQRVGQLAAQSRRTAEERKVMRGHMAHVNHELRAPLQAVLAFTELLEMDGLSEEQTEHVGRIATGGQRMLNLVNSLLDYERAESGHLETTLVPVDLPEAVIDAVEMLRPLCTPRGLTMRFVPPTGRPPLVLADPAHVDRILVNLLSNALKYNSDKGSVEVVVRTGPATVAVDVTDTGPGIGPADLDRIFQPFERLTGSGDAVGTGLGLPYARLLAEHLDGRLTARSVLGAGSTFTLELPQA